MLLKNDIYIENEVILKNLKRITNQIYKLLPYREEEIDWKSLLDSIIEELAGMSLLFCNFQEIFFSLLCRLEGLKVLDGENDFLSYRRNIFECLNKISELMKLCQD